MVKLKDEFQISEHYSLKEYDDYMEYKPLEQKIIVDFIVDEGPIKGTPSTLIHFKDAIEVRER